MFLLKRFRLFYFSCHSDFFLATFSIHLLMFLSVDVCIPVYLLFVLSLSFNVSYLVFV